MLLSPFSTSFSPRAQFNISTTFNGEPVTPSIANFTLEPSQDGLSLIITVRASFNDDPAPPVAEGVYFQHLYKYEGMLNDVAASTQFACQLFLCHFSLLESIHKWTINSLVIWTSKLSRN